MIDDQADITVRWRVVRKSIWSITKQNHIISFLPRCMQCRRGLAMRILSVRLSSVCPSVCLSVTRVHC